MKNPNMKYIEYHADDCSMGDTPPADCDKFRQWALVQIKREYPEYEITVSSKPALRETFTNDDERREEIELFCGRLWEACPWDWPQQDNESRAECECRTTRLDDVGQKIRKLAEEEKKASVQLFRVYGAIGAMWALYIAAALTIPGFNAPAWALNVALGGLIGSLVVAYALYYRR